MAFNLLSKLGKIAVLFGPVFVVKIRKCTKDNLIKPFLEIKLLQKPALITNLHGFAKGKCKVSFILLEILKITKRLYYS